MSPGGLGPGALVDYRDGEGVTAAVVLGEEKGRLRVVAESGREERITISRVALVAARGAGMPPRLPEAARRAAEHARAAGIEANDVDLPVVWDLLSGEEGSFSLQKLASIALGREDGLACGAVLRALLRERAYFVRKDELWSPRPREAVEELLHQKAREEARREAMERFLQRTRRALEEKPAPWNGDADEEEIWRKIEALAVLGQNAPEARGAVRILNEIGLPCVTPEEGAFRVGVSLGRFAPDENLHLRRFGLRRDFPPEVLEAARRAARRLEGIVLGRDGPARRDLRDEHLFTIDDASTVELDDALGARREPDGTILLGIHIADPSAFIERGDPVDAEAEARGTSHYLPDGRILMLPAEISEDAASLLPGRDRPALSFLVRLAPGGERLGWEIVPSLIRSRGRYSYDLCNAHLREPRAEPAAGEAAGDAAGDGEEDPDGKTLEAISLLWKVAGALEEERMACGAVRILAPEVEALPGPDGTIVLHRVDPDRPARRLVAEMMVLAGRLAAEHCLANTIPVLYRRQAPPEEPVISSPVGQHDPVAVRKARRAMRKGEAGPIPGPHAGLGLPAYVQATSPLRRYQDLVAHRQIAAHLEGRPLPYDLEALQRIAATGEETEKQARATERGTTDYWLLRYLEQHVGESVAAVVVETGPRRTDVELSETLVQASIAARPGVHEPGMRLTLAIERVVARAGLLVLREQPVGSEPR